MKLATAPWAGPLTLASMVDRSIGSVEIQTIRAKDAAFYQALNIGEVQGTLADGRKVAVVQIAGLVARRIVCFTRVGQVLRTGDRFGLIRFGSRLDVYLPDGVEPQVALGQTMVAGETVIADLTRALPARAARSE